MIQDPPSQATSSDAIADRLAQVRNRIARAVARAGRDADEITLVAVTKRVTVARIVEAYAAGARDFGESYVQEAIDKLEDIRLSATGVRWHFIGHLQSNKVRDVVGRFSLIHSVDTITLATTISRRAHSVGATADILLEVLLDPSGSKFGFAPDAVLGAASKVAALPGVRLLGLMGMAPYGDVPEEARSYFRMLGSLYSMLPAEHRKILSMGMSGDYEIAIEEGATMVRIGTAIFGERDRSNA